MRKKFLDKIFRIGHAYAFHTTHGVAHIFYFIAVMAEGHGMYAVIGGVMVVFSFITVLSDDDADRWASTAVGRRP